MSSHCTIGTERITEEEREEIVRLLLLGLARVPPEELADDEAVKWESPTSAEPRAKRSKDGAR